MEQQDLLSSLLAIATEQLDESKDKIKDSQIPSTPVHSVNKFNATKSTLKETDIFQLETNLKPSPIKQKPSSLIHTGDTDSSDDEGNRNYENQQYNENGRELKRLLNDNKSPDTISTSHYGVPKKRLSNWKTKPDKANKTNKETNLKTSINSPNVENKFQDILLDPIFCMRIVNPKISSSMLVEKMRGRLAVRFSDLASQIFAGNLKDKDWVISGVVVSKSPPRTSQRGSDYSIWTLSDLKDDIKTVALFMFSSAHKELWKTVVGTVVGVLNPSIMERREGSKDQASLSVDTAQKVMVFGQSKDFGICKSIKKNGDKCTAIVNLNQSEFCIFHIKQEYQKCSKRSELQANFAGQGLVNLRNKVLGKNEVFYAGKSYSAIPAKKSKKLEARDNNIMQNLNVISGKSNNIVKAEGVASKKKKGQARHLDVNPAQRARDLELLKKLGGIANLESKTTFLGIRSDDIALEESKATALNVISKLKAKNEKPAVAKASQFDLKGDLFVNVEGKNTFSGKLSENVSLEDSKNNALSVISKLKGKRTDAIGDNQIIHENNEEELLSLDDIEDKLNYSDDEDLTETLEPGQFNRDLESPCNANENKLGVNNLQTVTKNISQSSRKPLFGLSEDLPHFSSQKPDCESPIASPKVSRTSGLQTAKTPSKQNVTTRIETAATPTNSLHKGSSNLDKLTMGVPMLSGFGKGGFIDLAKPVTSRHVDRAKVNALKYIQRNGPIKKVDPNCTKGLEAKKRKVLHTEPGGDDSIQAKKSKLQESEFISDRFKKMMALSSKHADLVEHHDNQEKEKYFNKLEAKERMEEKMTNTHKLKCRAVKCLQCKYTSFSASELCKSEGHPLKVCTKFNEINSKLLSRGFIQLEKRHVAIYKRVKSALPRRESERKTHPLARHCDILQAVETRLSMLNMTYMRYIENRLICFIPGKVLDETKSILDLVESNRSPPRTHQLLQELRDLSSMAIEHFDEHILPRCREQIEQRSGAPEKVLKELEVVTSSLAPFTKFQGIMYKSLASTSKQAARILIPQQLPTLTNELYKAKKISQTHKHQISYLNQNAQKLCLKLRKQNNKLRIQASKLREQERKLQEQNSKIVEQEAALNDIKKHMDEWDQKYKDLTAELVRARDEILLKASSGNGSLLSPPVLSGDGAQSPTFGPQYKSNIKPRMAHILPKNYLTFDLERKRKSTLTPDVPVKRNRSPSAPGQPPAQRVAKHVQDLSLNIPDLVNFERNDSNKDVAKSEGTDATSKDKNAILSSFFDNLLSTGKVRKRKMLEDIDLK